MMLIDCVFYFMKVHVIKTKNKFHSSKWKLNIDYNLLFYCTLRPGAPSVPGYPRGPWVP